MIEAFMTKHGGIYPFKHITYAYPDSSSTALRIKTISSDCIVDLYFTSVDDKNQQVQNFIEYLIKLEPTTTELS